ncbi:hypothetical protein ACJX0J_029096, partial [Zea mays]
RKIRFFLPDSNKYDVLNYNKNLKSIMATHQLFLDPAHGEAVHCVDREWFLMGLHFYPIAVNNHHVPYGRARFFYK